MEKKGRPVGELKCPEWVRDLAFMVDITQHLSSLNKTLQGRQRVVTQYCDSICAFKLKLSLWETQLSKGNTSHFPLLAGLHASNLIWLNTKIKHRAAAGVRAQI